MYAHVFVAKLILNDKEHLLQKKIRESSSIISSCIRFKTDQREYPLYYLKRGKKGILSF